MYRFLSKHLQKAVIFAHISLKTTLKVTHKGMKVPHAHKFVPACAVHLCTSDLTSCFHGSCVSGEMGDAPSEHFGCCLLCVSTWCHLRWCLKRHTVTHRGNVSDTVNLASVFAHLWKRIHAHCITYSTQSETLQVSFCSIHFRDWRHWTLNLIGEHRIWPK